VLRNLTAGPAPPPIIVCVVKEKQPVANLQSRLMPFLEGKGYVSHLVDSARGGDTSPEELSSLLAKHPRIIIFTTDRSFLDVVYPQIRYRTADTYLVFDEVHDMQNKGAMINAMKTFERSLMMSATCPEALIAKLDAVAGARV
jgi:hypothetical protein